jgi:ATP-dependent Clp protease ATP-binding subunit ClpB
VEIQVQEVKKLVQSRGITLHIDSDVIDYLVEAGWDPEYGGRPVRRAIQNELQNPLAKILLSGGYQAGMEMRVSRQGGQLKWLGC